MQQSRFFSIKVLDNLLSKGLNNDNLDSYSTQIKEKLGWIANSLEQNGFDIKYGKSGENLNLFILKYFITDGKQVGALRKSKLSFVTKNEYTFNYSGEILSDNLKRYNSDPAFYHLNDPEINRYLEFKDFKYREINFIGHYTKMETVIEHILPANRLLLNSFAKANDPFENRKSFNIFLRKTDEDVFNILLEHNHAENELIRGYSNVISFISFSRNTGSKKAYGIPSMWAHYGQNHRGICLVFDKKRLNLLFEAQYRSKYKRDKISYGTLVYPSIEKKMEESPKDFFLNNSKKLFFQKDSCWKAEAEFRFIVIKEKEEEILFLENIDQALIAIVLGDDFNENYQCSVEKLLDSLPNKCIGIYKSQFKDGIYELEIYGKEPLYSSIDYLNDFYLVDL